MPANPPPANPIRNPTIKNTQDPPNRHICWQEADLELPVQNQKEIFAFVCGGHDSGESMTAMAYISLNTKVFFSQPAPDILTKPSTNGGHTHKGSPHAQTEPTNTHQQSPQSRTNRAHKHAQTEPTHTNGKTTGGASGKTTGCGPAMTRTHKRSPHARTSGVQT